mgnify:CR=1 FL=1
MTATNKNTIKRQCGDTIVEVLICITVLAMAFGVTFATVSASNKTMLSNKERFQAQRYANQQAEYIRASGGALRNDINSDSHCLYYDSVSTPKKVNFTEIDNPECQKEGLYKIAVTCQVQALNPKSSCNDTDDNFNIYKIKVEWDSLKGGTSNVELYYGG